MSEETNIGGVTVCIGLTERNNQICIYFAEADSWYRDDFGALVVKCGNSVTAQFDKNHWRHAVIGKMEGAK